MIVIILLFLVGIFIFGGEILKYLVLVLIIGFVVGFYFSIFIVSMFLVWWCECIGEFIFNFLEENL